MNWTLLQNSLLVSVATTLLAMALGFMAALWLTAAERAWRVVGLVLAIAALAMPPFLVTNSWLDLLGANGVLRGWLPLNIFSLPGAAWILALLLWPITALAVWSRWSRIEPELLEVEPAMRGAALVRHLLLPVARTPLLLAGALTFVLALNNFAVPAILQVKVFPAEMWVEFSSNFDSPAAFKLSLPLVIAPLILLAVFLRADISWPTMRGKMAAPIFRRQLGRGWWLAAGLVIAGAGILSAGVPVIQHAATARTWTELPGAVEAAQGALWTSVWLAAITATMSTFAALAFTHAVRHSSFVIASWLPFLVPGVLIGIAIIWLFNRPATAWFYSSFGVVLLAFVVRYFALGASITRHALQTTDRDLNDAAQLDGASRWQTLRFVQWPQIAQQVGAAWYVIYLLCLWDVESLVLIVPPGGETLALRIFNLLHYGHNAQVNALCLALLGAALMPLVLWMMWRWSKSRCALRVPLAAAAACCVLLAGCSPSSSSNSAPLTSKFFERAEIIATRGTGPGEVNKPRSVAVDHGDNLYVVDMTGRIQKFAPDGRFLLSWQMPNTMLGKPKGMGCDNDGNILVVEPHYKRVNHFTPEGKLVAQWGVAGSGAGQLEMPRSVAVNSKREIFISEYGLVERVQKFRVEQAGTPVLQPLELNLKLTDAEALATARPTPAQFLASHGQPGGGPGELNRAEGICVDAQDRLYVADSCNHRVQVFTSDGKFIREFGKPGNGPGELSYPYDVKVDTVGNIFVCEFGNSRIQVFDGAGKSVEIIGGAGGKPGQFNNPWAIALDSCGNLYVADALNHRVQKLVRRGQTAAAVEHVAGARAL